MKSQELDDFLLKLEKELKTGVLSLLVLHVIHSSPEPVHGYRIIQLIKESSDECGLDLKEGTIYAICRALQSHGFVENQIVDSDKGPPKKVFKITPDGRRALRAGLSKWKSLVHAVDTVLAKAGDGHDL